MRHACTDHSGGVFFCCTHTAIISKSKLFSFLLILTLTGSIPPQMRLCLHIHTCDILHEPTNNCNEKKCMDVPDILISGCQSEKWCKVISLVPGTHKHLEKRRDSNSSSQERALSQRVSSSSS